MSTTDATKASLRATTAAARRGMDPHERREASAAAVARLTRLPELRGPKTVLLYAATSEEPDPGDLVPLLAERGSRTLFPRVRDEHLDLVPVEDLTALRLGFRGIREPVGVAVDPGAVDVAIVPGLAFDPHGGRLGQGGGHYDRLLPELGPAVTIGLCFSCQVVPRVPMEEHDVAVDLVVTERSVHRPRHGGDDQAG